MELIKNLCSQAHVAQIYLDVAKAKSISTELLPFFIYPILLKYYHGIILNEL